MNDPGWNSNERIRIHGNAGKHVIVLHGGPAASGTAARVAELLSDRYTVFEPWQRRSTNNSLTVRCHINDLYELIKLRCNKQNPAIIGESWGAMLALAYAAEFPNYSGPLVLIGCGTFDSESRKKCLQTRLYRISEYIKKHPEHKNDLFLTNDQQIMKWHEMTDNYDCTESLLDYLAEPFDLEGHKQTWQDMIRCQEAGIYPQKFSCIKSDVIMLHGDYDPHPGQMIYNNLKQYIPHLVYHELENCGHCPWYEKHARDEFNKIMHEWLLKNY